jgi:hypothetical protein
VLVLDSFLSDGLLMLRPLSTMQRDLLVAHIDGTEVPVLRNVPFRYQAQAALVARGWLRWLPNNTSRPTASVITQRGRKELALLLAEWAEVIVQAHARAPTDFTKEWRMSTEFEAIARSVFTRRSF